MGRSNRNKKNREQPEPDVINEDQDFTPFRDSPEDDFERIKNRKQLEMAEQRLIIEKIAELRMLLSDSQYDDTRTFPGSEPMLKPTYDGHNRQFLERKLMELVAKL